MKMYEGRDLPWELAKTKIYPSLSMDMTGLSWASVVLVEQYGRSRHGSGLVVEVRDHFEQRVLPLLSNTERRRQEPYTKLRVEPQRSGPVPPAGRAHHVNTRKKRASGNRLPGLFADTGRVTRPAKLKGELGKNHVVAAGACPVVT